MDKQTDIIKRRYDRTARFYNITEKMMEMGGKMSLWKKVLWQQAKGKILEVGVGTGRNIEFYPDDAEVIGIDFSPRMIKKARERAAKLNKHVKLIEMDIQSLAFPDESFDTVICTCVFCSVPDPVKGLMEIKRVLKKEGQILMLEHVRSNNRFLGRFMDIFNPLVVRMIGANINRRTLDNLRKAGLTVETEKNLLSDIFKHLHCRK